MKWLSNLIHHIGTLKGPYKVGDRIKFKHTFMIAEHVVVGRILSTFYFANNNEKHYVVGTIGNVIEVKESKIIRKCLCQ